MTFYAKKSLGQNFLKSKQAIRSIISAGNLTETDTVLEIGPGKGVLTEELLKKAGMVIAIEKDHRLIELLQEKFRVDIKAGKCKIIEGDIEEISPESLSLADHSYKLIANIPYYVTGLVIRKFLETGCQPERMVLMLQYEVAKRIVARDLKESILSISVKAYGTPRYIEKVPAKYFSPKPNVDSAILLIENISKKNFADISESEFFKIVKAGFAHKRKILIGNIKSVYDQNILEDIFLDTGITTKSRAEDISIQTWLKLTRLIITRCQ